jgi:heat shock protein HtpX
MSGAKQQTLAGQLTTRLMAPFMGVWLKLTIGNKSYFLADQVAAKMLESPQQLAKVLWKLDTLRSTSPYCTPLSCTHHFIVNPLTGRTWSRYFHVQPSAEKRIRSLIGYYPI